MSCMYFHSLPSARVVSVGPVCDPQNQVGVIVLTGRIQKDKARRVDTSNTVCVQEYHVYSNVEGLRVLPADFLSPRRHHFVGFLFEDFEFNKKNQKMKNLIRKV